MKSKDLFTGMIIGMVLIWSFIPAVMAEECQLQEQSQTKEITLKEIPKELFLILPFGRDFTTLFSILPGINKESLLWGLSIHGASGAENRFFVDGVETTNLINGTSGQQVNLDFAESIEVKTFGFEAKDDAAMGGTIQVVTRSGSNQFHGGLTGYFTSNWLTGKERNALRLDVDDSSKAAYYSYEEYVGIESWNRFEPGFSLSGPIIKDKLWFYGSIMPQFYKLDRTCDFAMQGYDGAPQDYIRKETHMNYMVKLTAHPVRSLRLGASILNNWYRFKGNPASNHNSSPYYALNEAGFTFPNYSISGNADFTISSKLTLNLKGGYFYSNQKNQLMTADEPRIAFMAEQPYGYRPTTNEKWASEYAEMGESDKVRPPCWRPDPYAPYRQEVKRDIRERFVAHGNLSYRLETIGSHLLQIGGQYVNRREDMDYGPTAPYIYLAWGMDLELYGIEYGQGEYGWVGVRGNSKAPYGNIYNVRSEQWGIYLQDNWTIGDRLTLNLGVRTESECIPSYSDVSELQDIKPIKFSFADKISPRLGFVYDVFGDGGLKVFGHFGIYQDTMKLNMAAGAFGGFKWYSAYYRLDTLRYWEMDGEFGGMEPWAVINHRKPTFDTVDPGMKPITQREISIGFQKILSPNLILSGYVINKSLLQAIEDVGIVLPGLGEYYYYTNPGSDFVKSKYQEARDAGTMEPDTPDLPRAKREYWGVTLTLDKKFANNWLGGVSVTWSSLRGNYSGLANSDEDGRNSPHTERAFDLWHLLYTKDQQPIDGPLPTDRPIVLKAYGSYVTPFGLTVGAVVNGMSGTPITEEWNIDSTTYYPFNRGNMGRTPFLWLTDLLIGYDIHLGKVTLNLNVTVQNLFNVKTATGIHNEKTRFGISPTDREKIDNSWIFEGMGGVVDPRFGMDNTFVPPIQIRLGAKLLF